MKIVLAALVAALALPAAAPAIDQGPRIIVCGNNAPRVDGRTHDAFDILYSQWTNVTSPYHGMAPARYFNGIGATCDALAGKPTGMWTDGSGTFVNAQNTKVDQGIFAPYAVWERRPSEVIHWNAIATSTLVLVPGAASGAPPTLQISMGMTQGAVYDAINAITLKRHRPYAVATRFSPTASEDVAAATAAYTVLSNIISTVPARIAFPNRATLLQSLASQYAASLAAIPDSSMKAMGIAAGKAAADAMIAARENDGRFGPSQWVSISAPGYWQPLLPNGTSQLDPTAWLGGVRPFLLKSPSQFRTAGPQALSSAAWAAEFNEVKALGGDGMVTPTTRNAAQTHNALFWQSAGGPALLWNGVARKLADDPSYALDNAETARLLAMMNLSGADAAINCWNDKYHFNFWRPWEAIRKADIDGNPATVADPTWTPLLTAPYPEHPSGHLCLDGALVHSMRLYFGTDAIRFGVTSSQFGGETRSFDRFSQALDEIVEARIWAGLHFRSADVQARDLGTRVADYMVRNYFQPGG